MKQPSPLSRLAQSSLQVLILALILFYAAWIQHKVTSNTLTNAAGVITAFAGVLWSAQNTGTKLGSWLDHMLLLLVPRTRSMQIIGGLLGFGVFVSLVLNARFHQPVPGGGLDALPGYQKWCGAFILMVLTVLGYESSRELVDKLEHRFEWGEGVQQAMGWLLAVFLGVFGWGIRESLLWTLGAYCIFFTGVGLLRVLVSPISLSGGIKEIAGGSSVSVAFVFLLCCFAFLLLVLGLLI